MKKALVTAAVAAACSSPLAVLAQAAQPEYTISGNAGLFSDYRFRGYTQTDYNPAFQGGIDFAHKSGFYLGNWNSNINSTLYNGASLEMDFYGGYKATFGDFGLDVGTIYYFYPGTGQVSPGLDAKNWEVYVGGTWGPLSAKYYYAFTDWFGLKAPGIDSKGSQYIDLAGTLDLGNGLGVVGHVGWQKVKNGQQLGLTKDTVYDYKLGVTYDVAGSGWIAGAALVATSEKNWFLVTDGSEGAGKSSVVVSLTKSF